MSRARDLASLSNINTLTVSGANVGIGSTLPQAPLQIVGIGTTTLLVSGNARVTGTLSIGTSSITLDGNANTISGVTTITDSSGGYLSHPPGTIIFHSASTAPAGYIKANGATISRSAYSALFNTLGTTYGAGDGSTTFQIPDMRGQFPRGFDDGAGVDSGRTFGSSQSHQIAYHKHATWGEANSSFTFGNSSGNGHMGSSGGIDYDNYWFYTNDGSNIDNTLNAAGLMGNETRPRNVALLACIKY